MLGRKAIQHEQFYKKGLAMSTSAFCHKGFPWAIHDIQPFVCSEKRGTVWKNGGVLNYVD